MLTVWFRALAFHLDTKQHAFLRVWEGETIKKSFSNWRGATVNHWLYTFKFRFLPLSFGNFSVMSPLIPIRATNVLLVLGLERFHTGVGLYGAIFGTERGRASYCPAGSSQLKGWEGPPSPLHRRVLPGGWRAGFFSSCSGSKDNFWASAGLSFVSPTWSYRNLIW